MRTPPGPAGLPLVGNMPAFFLDPTGFLEAASREHGDVVRLTPVNYLFCRPDDIQEILHRTGRSLGKATAAGGQTSRLVLFPAGILAADGEVWRRRRKVTQPAFHRGDMLARYTPVIEETIDAAIRLFSPGKAVDFHREMRAVTLKIIARALFGADLGSDASRVADLLDTLMTLARRPFRLPRWVPTPGNLRLRSSLEAVNAWIDGVIEGRRRRGKGEQEDLLDILLAEHEALREPDSVLRDQMGSLLLGGHETTAATLAWCFDLLARHPAAANAIADEPLSGGEPGPTTSALENVLLETLRLYPPIWLTTRLATEPQELGGYPIPQGVFVAFSHYLSHRDPRNFAEPSRFLPARWEGGSLAARLHKYAYLPFGGGPRYCIGQPLAELEMRIIVSRVTHKLRLAPASGREVPIEASISLRPSGGVPIVVTPRR